jgi:DNA-binding NarL/FixJ family response regulator
MIAARDEIETAAGGQIRIAVGDERRMIAEALAALVASLPGFAVTAVVAGEAGVCSLRAHPPDLVLAGVDPRSRTGFGLVRALRAAIPEVEVVIVTDALQPDVVRLVFDQRLGGLLLTNMPASDVARSLDEIAHGHAVLPVGWQRMLVMERTTPSSRSAIANSKY